MCTHRACISHVLRERDQFFLFCVKSNNKSLVVDGIMHYVLSSTCFTRYMNICVAISEGATHNDKRIPSERSIVEVFYEAGEMADRRSSGGGYTVSGGGKRTAEILTNRRGDRERSSQQQRVTKNGKLHNNKRRPRIPPGRPLTGDHGAPLKNSVVANITTTTDPNADQVF